MRVLTRALGLLVYTLMYSTYALYRRYAHTVRWFFVARYMRPRKEWIGLCAAAARDAFQGMEGVEKVDFQLFMRGPGYSPESKPDGLPLYYLEAPLLLTLHTKEGLVALAALEFRGRALCIRQLQGIAGAHIPSKLKNWPKRFVEACMLAAECAEEEPLEEVRVYNADRSLFFRFPILSVGPDESYKEALLEHQRRMRRRYEGTARQLGFKKERDWYVWRVEK